eukprot:gene232-809_t
MLYFSVVHQSLVAGRMDTDVREWRPDGWQFLDEYTPPTTAEGRRCSNLTGSSAEYKDKPTTTTKFT